MSEELQKYLSTDEPDPAALAARKDDSDFLSLYRSLNTSHLDADESVVRGSVDNGVVPAAVRYGIMRRGPIEVIRGVVKSTSGEFFYFNWNPAGDDVHLVKADDDTKQWEAQRLFKSCVLGCDLRKSESSPLDPGETVEEASDDDDDKGDLGQIAAQAPISEDQNIASQQRLSTDVHPGATTSGAPDDENVGRDWHGEDVVRSNTVGLPGDAVPIPTSSEHWSATDLLKAWGQRMQATAPRLAPAASDLEQRYMTEVMGMTPDQINKGMTIAPRHRSQFQQWKASQLRTRLSGLESFLKASR